jgi:mitogen-activated protein kinase 1/3
MEKDYGSMVDVWSIGCVFAELLQMKKENAPTYLDRGPLFPGRSCFPLSPDMNTQKIRAGYPSSD